MNTRAESERVSAPGEITRLIEAAREGDSQAAEKLVSQVYPELRRLAAARMAYEVPGHTLQPTALVHEASLRLRLGSGAKFPGRAYFFAAAGEAMRRILVEIARRKKRLKHGGDLERLDLDRVELTAPCCPRSPDPGTRRVQPGWPTRQAWSRIALGSVGAAFISHSMDSVLRLLKPVAGRNSIPRFSHLQPNRPASTTILATGPNTPRRTGLSLRTSHGHSSAFAARPR
jgi:hypothetical protein